MQIPNGIAHKLSRAVQKTRQNVSNSVSFNELTLPRDRPLKTRGRSSQAKRSSANATAVSGDGLSAQERKLASFINQYRQQHGLSRIKLSKALTTVANRHVQDLELHGVRGSLHAWSNAAYDASDPNTYPTIWNAPQRLKTGYPGHGYENAFGATGYKATAQSSFDAWKNSPSHNATLLNQDVWQNMTWNAMGVGIRGGFAALWLGEAPDPTGSPRREG